MITAANLPLPNEDTLNLELAVVSPSEGNQRIANGETHLQLNGKIISQDVATIPQAELEILYNQVSGYATPDKRCLTALQIFYGARDDGGEIVMDLFYKPVFLAYDHFQNNTHSYMYTIAQEGDLYKFRNGSFEAATSTEYDDALNLLKSELKIKHTLNAPNFEPFNLGVDVDRLLITFQTIFTYLVENDNTSLVLKNSIEIVIHELTNSVKQTLLLYTPEVNPNGPFSGQFANRQKWMPPVIAEYGFNLE
jgi:hypothetical protein|tara:strand:- start:9108 stop:9860 length:753 start_codon:yes stop_codon:yes gene_type:complete